MKYRLAAVALLVALLAAVSLYGCPPSARGSENGRLPARELAPIHAGQLATGSASAWNSLRGWAVHYSKGTIDPNGPASSYRTYAQQVYLATHCPLLCARPGTSNHGLGLAVDTGCDAARRVIDRYGGRAGWYWGAVPSECWHVQWHTGSYTRPDPGTSISYPTLRRGAGGFFQGFRVREIERRLGFKHPDGEFRANTAAAVQRYERSRHFRHPDGVVTKATWGWLQIKGPLKKKLVLHVNAEAARAGRSDAVARVQRAVNDFHTRYRLPNERLVVDGVAGPAYRREVRDAKFLLGYGLCCADWWAKGTNSTFLRRLVHPTYRMAAVAVRRGVRRRAARRSPGVSPAGVRFIASFEGYYARPYNDPVGYCTTGYGHLIAYRSCTAADRRKWGSLSQRQAHALLKADLAKYEQCVRSSVHVNLTQGQTDALVSFAYNVGCGALASSTLAKKLNARDYAGAAGQFSVWVRGGGRVLPGLVRRRAAEAAMFKGR